MVTATGTARAAIGIGEIEAEPLTRWNTDFWAGADLVHAYANADLRPVEATLIGRHRESLSGRVLEIGCGAGRVTMPLCEIAAEVHAIDVSQAMLSRCRRACPEAAVVRRDMRDLSPYEPASFGALVAPFNVLDVLDDADRHLVLDQFRRVLEPDGLLIFSSHNRAFAPRILGPVRQPLSHLRALRLKSAAAGIVHMPRRLSNHRRLRVFERSTDEYALFNDTAHDYSILHYYISRDHQARQLAEHDFELLECLDLDGHPVAPGELAAATPELHYIARRI